MMMTMTMDGDADGDDGDDGDDDHMDMMLMAVMGIIAMTMITMMMMIRSHFGSSHIEDDNHHGDDDP